MDILELVHDDYRVESRPFLCSYKNCPKAFARKSDLIRHARIHNNERPFSCTWPGCNKAFVQKSALTVHARIHSGEKPHICSECSKAFSDSSSLARHRRVHSGRRPYRCLVEDCHKSFCRKTTLTKHTRRNHAHALTEDALRRSQSSFADVKPAVVKPIASTPTHDYAPSTLALATRINSSSSPTRAFATSPTRAFIHHGAAFVQDDVDYDGDYELGPGHGHGRYYSERSSTASFSSSSTLASSATLASSSSAGTFTQHGFPNYVQNLQRAPMPFADQSGSHYLYHTVSSMGPPPNPVPAYFQAPHPAMAADGSHYAVQPVAQCGSGGGGGGTFARLASSIFPSYRAHGHR